GVIRYKIDRDQQVGQSWSAKLGRHHAPTSVCPSFERPFSFAELEFEAGTKVVGSVGIKPGAVPGRELYYRGTLDAFGDEWHSLTVADDDGGFQDDYNSGKWSSDGKIWLFVVDPKTPCLSLHVRNDQAQFYTTPAKTYFLPRIHTQTSYLSNGVALQLTNISNDRSMSFRIDGGTERRYTGPLRSDDFTDGVHVLEYWIEGGPHKQRALVKNPSWPSTGERHPKLLWADERELAQIKARMQREPYKATYEGFRQEGGHAITANLGKGRRTWVGGALESAFVARIEGAEAKAAKGTHSYASLAKRVLLDNKLCYDPVGIELSHNFDPMPTAEWNSFGYYVVDDVFDLALAYDLLISFYRSDQCAGGITPIEDLKIRDALAHWNAVQMYDLRGYESRPHNPQPEPGTGMWDMARLSGAAVAAMAIPSYDTPYYGTSGFDDRTKATHRGIPFAEQAFTWKELFINADQPLGTTPNLYRRFNHLEGGLITVEGFWFDRPGYFDYPLMGHCLQILANTSVLSCGKRWAHLEHAFQRAEEGTMEGKKINSPDDRGARSYTQILLANPRFPELAARICERVQRQPAKTPEGQRNDNNLGFQLYRTRALGLIWFQDDISKP
ncbi:MAG: hypothetical protein AAB263_00840, partial [Planctomycetota bacterium]